MEVTNKITPRKFVCLDNVSKFLYCSICDEIFQDPVRLKSCGHTYCLSCILQWSKHNLNCPLCREPFSENDIRNDLIASSIINDLEIYCINLGCPWKGRLMDLPGHLKKCYFNPSEIPEYIKEVLIDKKENKKDNSENENSDNNIEGESESFNDNNLTSFNTKSSLRARLYNRNRELVNKIFSKSGTKDGGKNCKNKKESEILRILKENNITI